VQGPEVIVAFTVVATGGAAVILLARAIAKRIAGGGTGAREVEALRDEVAQLRAEVDQLHDRVAPVDEIQNRLDFTERLLAQVRERGQLSAPKEH